MKIKVFVDGQYRYDIDWRGSLSGLEADDIRLAKKLKANKKLWEELIEKQIAATGLNGANYLIHTKAAPEPKFLTTAVPSPYKQRRALEEDHPFNEACQWIRGQ